ncbi:MAG: helix-turn-helix transcriptional regulator [Pseudomonadota bacterium]
MYTCSDDIFLNDLQICKRYSISRSTWWRWVSAGYAPKGVKIGPRATRWRLSVLVSWEEENKLL